MKQSINILISGGGTGGHIYPAIAIANELKLRYPNSKFLFVGAKDKMEMEKVPQAGYEIKGLWIAGIQRKITFTNVLFPFKLLSSLLKSRRIIKQFKPNIAIGTGGFASGPALLMASLNKIPTLIQEQNSYPGITNKLLAKKSHKICVAYDHLERFFPADKILKTGNPVRQDLLLIHTKRDASLSFFNLNKNKKTVLVLGGSLGARRVNELIESQLDFFNQQNLQVIWQCGKLYNLAYQKYHDLAHVQVHPFINQMGMAYAASDFIISRAGASSVSELCIVGKPVLFIPSPNVAEDHQTKNAQALVDQDAAIMLKEAALEDEFDAVFSRLVQEDSYRQALGTAIKLTAMPHATRDIVDQLRALSL